MFAVLLGKTIHSSAGYNVSKAAKMAARHQTHSDTVTGKPVFCMLLEKQFSDNYGSTAIFRLFADVDLQQ